MAKCKLCGKPVAVSSVFHSDCWKAETEKLAETFCDEYCHWPYVCKNETELDDEHCSNCALIRVLNLGL